MFFKVPQILTEEFWCFHATRNETLQHVPNEKQNIHQKKIHVYLFFFFDTWTLFTLYLLKKGKQWTDIVTQTYQQGYAMLFVKSARNFGRLFKK